MSKLLIIIGLIAAFLIIKHLINNTSRSKTGNGDKENAMNSGSSSQSLEFKKTVKCHFCGTHIPVASAFKSGEHHYCNESHYQKSQAES